MKLGKFEVNAVDTGLFHLDGGAMFGVVPKALWSKKYNHGDEKNRIPLAARPLLIEFDNKKILVDTGNGNKREEKFMNIYGIDASKSSIALGLKTFNLKPEDITDVILTHLHFDHTGGSTIIENQKLIPTFPNAKYYVQKEHFDWAMKPTDKDRASFINDDFEPLIREGILEFTNGEMEIFDGISVIPVNGHTQALQMVKLKSQGESLIYISDLSPTVAHLTYTFGLAYDNFPLTTMEEKKKLLPKFYEENTIVCFEHDAFIQACRLADTGKGFGVGEIITISS
ncbi:MAG: MBL fold metallo-hydrolase [Candidatus Kapabacteria bacterium]|nr:MBL fold metallo-hydrolase [Ignavibacteriota bacterium]MCW5884135.1 MBL fold metallo-hydrolase [Candidatus Kapabacteria bacterium]